MAKILGSLSSTTSSVNCKYTSATTTIGTTDTDIVFPTKVFDSHNAYNASTGVYTTPAAGVYRVTAAVRRASTSASGFNNAVLLQVFKNGSLDSNLAGYAYQQTASPAQIYIGGSTTIKCGSGDSIKISGIRDTNAGSGALDGVAANNYVDIEKVGD